MHAVIGTWIGHSTYHTYMLPQPATRRDPIKSQMQIDYGLKIDYQLYKRIYILEHITKKYASA